MFQRQCGTDQEVKEEMRAFKYLHELYGVVYLHSNVVLQKMTIINKCCDELKCGSKLAEN